MLKTGCYQESVLQTHSSQNLSFHPIKYAQLISESFVYVWVLIICRLVVCKCSSGWELRTLSCFGLDYSYKYELCRLLWHLCNAYVMPPINLLKWFQPNDDTVHQELVVRLHANNKQKAPLKCCTTCLNVPINSHTWLIYDKVRRVPSQNCFI